MKSSISSRQAAVDAGEEKRNSTSSHSVVVAVTGTSEFKLNRDPLVPAC